jgi:hypothetical protein
MSPSYEVTADARIEAINQLKKRDSPAVSAILANLLQPHEELKLRRAAASALTTMSCETACIRSILHYLERIWSGQPNSEDLLVGAAASDEAKAVFRSGQAELYDNLYKILNRHAPETVSSLIQLYGLGSTAPSIFALDLISHLRLQQACPYLMQSQTSAKNFPPQFYRFPRQELDSAIKSAECK